eukprot:TRINITY_DN80621_c0_g1_i1.p1 TRINITY_DN80621_c0_g1~~TRINITY_DN80621_c0_g1_i1.p1  ORF type:complete len:213 (-),score=65.10 TRINITY_DN80621_c0_g1_i1:86-724(-)
MEESLTRRIQELLAQDSSLGYRALHAQLKLEPEFAEVGLKKVQLTLQQLRQEPAARTEPAERRRAGPGENLWTAASDGDIARVDELLALEGFTPSSKDENGYTPVMAAASWGHVDLLRLLLQRDSAAANVGDEDGDAPLHHVAQATELEVEQLRPVIEVLLSSRADPNLKNSEGKTCLDCCAQGALDGEEEEEPVLNMNFIKVMEEHGVKAE